MNILFAASEAVPFIKSGGLADVAGALPAALCRLGHDCRVVLPLYRDIPSALRQEMTYITTISVPLSWRRQVCGVYTCWKNNVQYYFLENPYCFDRCGSYGFFDDGERFALFSRAVLEMLLHLDFSPAVIHCNDWQTALIPVFLHAFFSDAEKLRGVKTVLTIHNIQYQGAYGMEVAGDILGLPPHMVEIVEYSGSVNYLKGGMEMCHALTTVSPTYAQEILSAEYGHGLEPFLRERRGKISGILNGIDCAEYDPVSDACLPYRYTADDLSGKAANKSDLQRQLGLNEDGGAMLIGMVGRLVGHKGLDLVCSGMERLMNEPVQFVLLGCGDSVYEQFFREAAMRWPGRISVTLGFDEAFARRIYAGADVFLMPSRSEPCGLAQMIALRYGTPPIVRLTGGLRDTVRDFGGENGNGYTFQTCMAEDMLDAVRRALRDYADQANWQEHCRAAMQCDNSWTCSAEKYIHLYKNQ